MTETLFVDIENDDHRLLMTGWTLDEGDVVVTLGPDVPPLTEGVEDWAYFLTLLKDPSIVKVSQSGHDMRWFRKHGYEVAGEWHNTMVMAWVHDENQKLDQASLLSRYAPDQDKTKRIRPITGRLCFEDDDGRGYWLDEYDVWPDRTKKHFIEYNRNDVATLRELYRMLARALMESGRVNWWREEQVPYSPVLLNMECRGLPVNLDDCKVLADEVRAERDRAAAQLLRTARLPAHFNLNSPKQLREYLFNKWFVLPDKLPMDMDPLPSDQDFEVTKVGRLWIEGRWTLRGRGLAPTDPPKRKPGESESTDPSTASPELLYKHGTDSWVNTLCLDYRRNAKLLGTYLDKFPVIAVGQGTEPGTPVARSLPRIYGRFNQTGTVTGRLSSSEPNLQNIPARREMGKRVRALFQGQFVIGDYDALEMRLMAHYSRDPRLVKVFAEDGDPHLLTAEALFGGHYDHESQERDIAKTVNYAIGYGAGAKKLAQTLTLGGFATPVGVAREYLQLVQEFYPGVFRWNQRTIWRAKDTGFVTTIGGHNRHLRGNLEDVAGWNQVSYGERQAVNSIIQGSAADILRRVMLNVDKRFPDLPMLAQVHDELIFEYEKRPTKETLASLQVICEQGHGYRLRVPLSFVPVICSDWSQKGEGIDLSILQEED